MTPDLVVRVAQWLLLGAVPTAMLYFFNREKINRAPWTLAVFLVLGPISFGFLLGSLIVRIHQRGTRGR